MTPEAIAESLRFVAYRVMPDGAIAGVLPQLMGNFRLVICRADPRHCYDDGW